jgi:hypothetical protein
VKSVKQIRLSCRPSDAGGVPSKAGLTPEGRIACVRRPCTSPVPQPPPPILNRERLHYFRATMLLGDAVDPDEFWLQRIRRQIQPQVAVPGPIGEPDVGIVFAQCLPAPDRTVCMAHREAIPLRPRGLERFEFYVDAVAPDGFGPRHATA